MLGNRHNWRIAVVFLFFLALTQSHVGVGEGASHNTGETNQAENPPNNEANAKTEEDSKDPQAQAEEFAKKMEELEQEIKNMTDETDTQKLEERLEELRANAIAAGDKKSLEKIENLQEKIAAQNQRIIAAISTATLAPLVPYGLIASKLPASDIRQPFSVQNQSKQQISSTDPPRTPAKGSSNNGTNRSPLPLLRNSPSVRAPMSNSISGAQSALNGTPASTFTRVTQPSDPPERITMTNSNSNPNTSVTTSIGLPGNTQITTLYVTQPTTRAAVLAGDFFSPSNSANQTEVINNSPIVRTSTSATLPNSINIRSDDNLERPAQANVVASSSSIPQVVPQQAPSLPIYASVTPNTSGNPVSETLSSPAFIVSEKTETTSPSTFNQPTLAAITRDIRMPGPISRDPVPLNNLRNLSASATYFDGSDYQPTENSAPLISPRNPASRAIAENFDYKSDTASYKPPAPLTDRGVTSSRLLDIFVRESPLKPRAKPISDLAAFRSSPLSGN